MARKKTRKNKPARAARPSEKEKKDTSAADSDDGKVAKKNEANTTDAKRKEDGWRETVESIVVAFILAFLFRTFEAEAFVIPTGSMAPTLYGRHKDINCEKCGYQFAIGASDELDKATGRFDPDSRIQDVVCPNCRYITPAEVVRNLPVFKGDRILVNKFPYEFGRPKRWDVVVFKYPEEPYTNYIKRLVGLPGETIEIRQGDVYRETDEGIQILRKNGPDKQRELQILVYDNDHPARQLLEAGWPERWAPLKQEGNSRSGWSPDDNGWTPDAEARTFALSAANGGDGYHWIRYRHFIPSQKDWDDVSHGKPFATPRPKLITDFCGYNAYTGGDPNSRDSGQFDLGIYWVGDLTVRCEADVAETGDDGELLLELNEGYRFYRCRFDLAAGTCTLLHSDDNLPLDDPQRERDLITLATAESPLQGAGTYELTFANVDDRLMVWVDGTPLDFGTDDDGQPKNHYRPFGGETVLQAPSAADLAPVGIAARRCDATVAHLLLQRDIYYRSEKFDARHPHGHSREYQPTGKWLRPDSDPDDQPAKMNNGQYTIPVERHALRRLLDRPSRWWDRYTGGEGHPHLRFVRFERLASDEYFMLGDNSPRSQDSRLWTNQRGAERRHAVPGTLLVGKAFFIYWPHGVPFLNDGKGFSVRYHRSVDGRKTDYPSFRVPFYPNVTRMHRIR